MIFNPLLTLHIALALLVCYLLYRMQKAHLSFTKRVFTALGLGVLLGAALQGVYGAGAPLIKQTNAYLDIIGTGYVQLLQMIIMPLIMVSIVSAIIKLKDARSLGKISVLTIGMLMLTTMIAAAIGILMAKRFGLNAAGLTARAAMRVGAGLVSLAVPEVAWPVYAAAMTGVMVHALPAAAALDGFAELLADPRRNAVAIGPGAGIGEPAKDDRSIVFGAAIQPCAQFGH